MLLVPALVQAQFTGGDGRGDHSLGYSSCLTAIEVANTNDAGAGSLRQAIAGLCNNGTITFNASLNAATITLTSGELLINKGLTIDASGLADGISVSGDSAFRVFKIDCGTADVTMNNLTIKKGLAAVEGGGIYQTSSGTVTLNNLTFNSNSALWGGAIYQTAGTQTFTNCLISGNFATGTGAAGGGFYQKNGTATFNNCEILYNVSTTFAGGIYLESDTAAMTLNGCTVSGNTVSDGAGGGMYLNNGTVHLNNCQINENHAQYLTQFGDGGAIYLFDGTLSTNSTSIKDNNAANCGGGLFIHSAGAAFSSTDDTISGNLALAAGNVATPKGGGGVYVYHGHAEFLRTVISGNQTAHKGGGIYLSVPTGIIALSSCIVSGNETKNGATNDVNYGGAIFIDTAHVDITNSAFTGNKATRTDSNGPKGGAIYLFKGTLDISGTSFASNQTNTVQGKGGAIFNDLGTLTSSQNCTFTSNSAGRSGGAVFNNQPTAKMTSSNCTFTSNSAARLGGALYMQDGTMTNDNCVFSLNSTTGILGVEAGGAINHNLGTATTTNCTIKNNASTTGGGYCFKNGTASIINSLIIDNAANTYGGGIFAETATASLTLANSTLSGNTSVSGGGGIANQASASIAINNTILWNNSTSGTGNQIGNSTATPIVVKNSCYSTYSNDMAGTITPSACTNAYPDFVTEVGKDFRLGGNSPCADAGDNALCDETTDIRGAGYARKLSKTSSSAGTIDMGAYEFKFGSDPEFGCTNPTSGGTISQNQEGCVSLDPVEITCTAPTDGHGTLEYKWQKSTTSDTTGFIDISSATNVSYTPGTLTATTWYRRVARVICMIDWKGAAVSGAAKMTVYPAFTTGDIKTSGDTICYSGNPDQIGNDTLASGGDGKITYRWQKSTDNSVFGNISGATLSTFDPPNGLNETTWYRRQAKDSTCNAAFANSGGVWKVLVYDQFTTGAIKTTGDTICYNGDPDPIGNDTLASGGHGTVFYQWQKSTDNNSFGNISGATLNAYDPPSGLTTTTWYRRQAKEETCNTAFANSRGVWKVLVYPTTVGGAVTGGTQVCYGLNSALLTLSGQTGSVQKWQYSTNDTLWNDIPGTTSTTYTATNLTVKTWFRAAVASGVCASENSSSTLITINSNYKISGYAKYDNNPKTLLSGLKVILVKNPATLVDSVVTGTNGFYQFNNLTNGTYKFRIISAHPSRQWQTWSGVNNTDYLLALRHATTGPLLPGNPPVIRISGDVKAPQTPPVITTVDADAIRMAAKYGWGNPSYFQIPKWVFSGVTLDLPIDNIALTCANLTRDIRGLCAGDVNGTHLPLNGYKMAEPSLELVNRGTLPVTPEITFPVRAERDMELGAITLMLDYDTTMLEITGVDMPDNGGEAPYFVLRRSSLVLEIGWTSLNPVNVAAGQTVLLINAKVKKYERQTTNNEVRMQFTLNESPLSELADGEGNVLNDARLSVADAGFKVQGSRLDEQAGVVVYPNPAKEVLNVEYFLEKQTPVQIELLNMQGIFILKLPQIRQIQIPGWGRERLDISGVLSGVYMLKVTIGDQVEVRKVIVNR